MTDEPRKDPGKKMRSLLRGGRTLPMTRLPKKADSAVSFLPHEEENGREMKAPFLAAPNPASSSKGMSFGFGPLFWTIASVISLTVNVILVIVLLIVLLNMQRFNVGNAMNMGNSLLGGLYTNFEKMDRASIDTNVQVNTTIPVKFYLQLNHQTNVVLSQNVTIDNAQVTVKTGGLNITNALTTIVLPQVTTLPIVLNLTVPVDTTVPVTLNVPVDIPLNQTQLHEPFVGLQDVIRPFYCLINSSAFNLDNQPICK